MHTLMLRPGGEKLDSPAPIPTILVQIRLRPQLHNELRQAAYLDAVSMQRICVDALTAHLATLAARRAKQEAHEPT